MLGHGAVASQGGLKGAIVVHDITTGQMYFVKQDFSGHTSTYVGTNIADLSMPEPTSTPSVYFIQSDYLTKVDCTTGTVTPLYNLAGSYSGTQLYVSETLNRFVFRDNTNTQMDVRGLGSNVSYGKTNAGSSWATNLYMRHKTSSVEGKFYFTRQYHDGSEWRYPIVYSMISYPPTVTTVSDVGGLNPSASVLGMSAHGYEVIINASTIMRANGSTIKIESGTILSAYLTNDGQYVIYTIKESYSSLYHAHLKKLRISDGVEMFNYELENIQLANREYYARKIRELNGFVYAVVSPYNTLTSTYIHSKLYKVDVNGGAVISYTMPSITANNMECTNMQL